MSSAKCKEVLELLKSRANPASVAGMARYGINPHQTLGISIPFLRQLAREIGRQHSLAEELWSSGIHEARILAGYIDDSALVSEAQMELWAADFDSWDVCDQCCSNLFDRTPHAKRKAVEWSRREEEFVKRAGFVLMAQLAVHDKKAPDSLFEAYLIRVFQEALDERNYVRKAVNWALRSIGKRNPRLNSLAIRKAEEIQKIDSKSARWIADDALRELGSEKIQQRMKEKQTHV